MKKVLLAFDGKNYSAGAFEFVRQLNEYSPVLVTGVFLPQAVISNLWSYASGISGPMVVPLVEEDDVDEMSSHIERFEKECISNNIDYVVHKEFREFALPELIKETRFADLVVLCSESFYENLGGTGLNLYLEDVLKAAECPVITVPEKACSFDSTILAYDGSKSASFAMKQFAYLFPEWRRRPTVLLYADANTGSDFPERENVEEWASRHFSNLTLLKLDVHPQKEFAAWLRQQPNALLVSGSFGRSGLSQLLKKSFVSDVINDCQLPVFVTHR